MLFPGFVMRVSTHASCCCCCWNCFEHENTSHEQSKSFLVAYLRVATGAGSSAGSGATLQRVGRLHCMHPCCRSSYECSFPEPKRGMWNVVWASNGGWHLQDACCCNAHQQQSSCSEMDQQPALYKSMHVRKLRIQHVHCHTSLVIADPASCLVPFDQRPHGNT